ncbi:uncharacterized protein LOC128670763 [Plodia interpunctella]|uniref:uncharacterized protein LOC128670763 n=1 Tax=Plodia interpunctella TaxID=58824 RepID=UPI0023680AFD|nr:uncharacterized protein LOC128670763 [Plodia interpunctella]
MAVTLFKISALSYLSILCSATQSFSRQDIPFFKYTTQHDLTESRLQKKNSDLAVQYAPLYSPEIHIRNEMDILPKMSSNENFEVKRKFLEPNLASYSRNALPYVPGHNIEILQSVNRSPGLPVEYRSIQETTEAPIHENESEKKVNYHRAFSVFKKPENILNLANHVQASNENSVPPTSVPLDEYTRIFKLITNQDREDKYNPEPLKNMLDQQLLRNHQTMQDIHELTKQIESQRVVGYPKMNTMLLNLARVYSPRAPTFNLINYLDTSEVGMNTHQFIKSPSVTFSETRRGRGVPMVISKPKLSIY